MKNARKQAGDTIVEVMLSLAVISSVLGAAYAATARNIKLGRQAQERTEAVELVKGQVDLLKFKTSAGVLGLSSATKRFCIDVNGVIKEFGPAGALGNEPNLTADGNDGFNSYPAECKRGIPPYNLFIVRDSSDARLYRAYARWFNVKGDHDQVQYSYRVYQN